MRKKQSAELISPNFDKKINVHAFMKDYYIKIGYHNFPKIQFLKKIIKIYIIYFRKLRIISEILFKSKFIFNDPPKKDLIIYDCANSHYLEIIMDDINFEILSTRIKKIKKIFLTKNVVFYILKNFGKKSLKQNYIAAIIKLMEPKVVITHVDNNPDFHITSKIFENSEIKFIAIQAANRGDTVYRSNNITEKIFIPEYLCFSKFDQDIHENKNCKIKKYTTIGSLNVHLALNYIKSKKIVISPDLYDICLVAEPMPESDGDYSHINNFQDKLGQVANYTYRFANENKLKIIFSGKAIGKEQIEGENVFYKNYLKKFEFKISSQEMHKFTTYLNMMKSKIVIGLISTSLREAFILKKKVLSCNFTGHKDVIFPSSGICSFSNEVSYEEFKERLTQIINMDFEEYKNKLSKDVDYIMNSEIDPIKFVQDKIKSYVTKKT